MFRNKHECVIEKMSNFMKNLVKRSKKNVVVVWPLVVNKGKYSIVIWSSIIGKFKTPNRPTCSMQVVCRHRSPTNRSSSCCFIITFVDFRSESEKT